jgi:hypothetical protein
MLFFVYWEQCTTNLNREGVSVLYIQFIDINSDRVISLTLLYILILPSNK